MRPFVLSVLLAFGFSAAALPVISHVNPSYGFSFGPTLATVHGSGFGQDKDAVQVFVGGEPAVVHSVTPTAIRVTIYPPGQVVPANTRADVRVVTQDGDVTVSDRFTFSTASDTLENYTAYLVPFTTEVIDGANGSRWTAELTFFNRSDYPAGLLGPFGDPRFLSPPQAPYVEIGRHRTQKPPLFGNGRSTGAFIYVPNPLVDAVKKSQRVRDLSQNAASWGTELPIVPREDAKTGMWLIDIPTDPKYRATLRIYHWSQQSGLPARVTIHAPNRTAPVAEYVLHSNGFGEDFEEGLSHPAYSQVDLLTPDVRAAGATIHVEIDNMSANVSPPFPHIWAFVSITNNETQQVTIVTANR